MRKFIINSDDFSNLFKFAKNIQDRVGVVRCKFRQFQAKLPLGGSECRNCLNLHLNPSGMGNFVWAFKPKQLAISYDFYGFYHIF